MGRPTLIDVKPERVKRLLESLENGNFRDTACICAGIGYSTFKIWMQKGRKGLEPYASFMADVKEAENRAEEWHVANIKQASVKQWQASAWWMERKRPRKWAKPEVKLGLLPTADNRPVSESELEAILEPIIARRVADRLSAKGSDPAPDGEPTQ